MKLHRILVCLLAIALTPALQAQGTSKRVQLIQQKSLLKVCTQEDYPSISFINSKTKKLEGLDIDLAFELAKELAVKVEFVQSSALQVAAQLRRNDCDVAMFALLISPELSKQVRFTKPVMVSDVYGVTTYFNRRIKSWDDIKKPGSVVTVLKGSLHEKILKEQFKNLHIEAQDSLIICEYEVESGRADLLLTDYQNSRRLLESKEWVKLVTPVEIVNRSVHAYASDFNDEIWGEMLDKFVKDIKRDGRLIKAARKYNIESMVVTR